MRHDRCSGAPGGRRAHDRRDAHEGLAQADQLDGDAERRLDGERAARSEDQSLCILAQNTQPVPLRRDKTKRAINFEELREDLSEVLPKDEGVQAESAQHPNQDKQNCNC